MSTRKQSPEKPTPIIITKEPAAVSPAAKPPEPRRTPASKMTALEAFYQRTPAHPPQPPSSA